MLLSQKNLRFQENKVTMVSHASQVVQVQPQTLSSSSVSQLQAQADKNGEQIIKEIDVSNIVFGNVNTSIFQRSSNSSILMRYLGSGPHFICFKFSSDCCDCCSCDGCGICIPIISMYMYLTSTCIHIVQKTGTVIISDKQIPLIDITEIKAVGWYADAGYCGLGTRITSPSVILMELRPDAAKQFLPICYRCCSLPIVLAIYCNEDPTDFVIAIKQSMVTMPRQ